MVVSVTVAFVLLGGWWFILFVTGIVGWTSYELWQLLRRAGHQSSLLITLLTALAAFFTVQPPDLALPIPFLALTLALLTSLAWLLPRVPSRCFADWAVSFAGGFYLGWAGGHLARLMALPPDGRWWLALTLATAWSADSAAYAFGRLFGRHRLAPVISPGKTWEGYVAGIALSTIAGFVHRPALSAATDILPYHRRVGRRAERLWRSGGIHHQTPGARQRLRAGHPWTWRRV
jgi:phosphatidate cytidylyltransferase